MTKFLPSVLPIAVALLTAVTPIVQDWLVSHPVYTAAIASVFAVVNHWLPSPVKGNDQ